MASTLVSAQEALELVQELTPTLKIMSTQYQKAAPGVDWLIEYWPVAIAVTFVGIALGSAIGSVVPNYVKTTRRR